MQEYLPDEKIKSGAPETKTRRDPSMCDRPRFSYEPFYENARSWASMNVYLLRLEQL